MKTPEDQRQYNREYYHKNKDKLKKQIYIRTRQRYRRNLKKVQDIKVAAGCVDCGYDKHPTALHFDHLPEFEKYDDISGMVRDGLAWSRVLEEIGKCEVVCANCHAIRTADRRPR